jgi:hypothetical protein
MPSGETTQLVRWGLQRCPVVRGFPVVEWGAGSPPCRDGTGLVSTRLVPLGYHLWAGLVLLVPRFTMQVTNKAWKPRISMDQI